MAPTDFVTPREASRELGITLDRVYSLIWSGRLAAHKNQQGSWEIPMEAVAERKQYVANRVWEYPQAREKPVCLGGSPAAGSKRL